MKHDDAFRNYGDRLGQELLSPSKRTIAGNDQIPEAVIPDEHARILTHTHSAASVHIRMHLIFTEFCPIPPINLGDSSINRDLTHSHIFRSSARMPLARELFNYFSV